MGKEIIGDNREFGNKNGSPKYHALTLAEYFSLFYLCLLSLSALSISYCLAIGEDIFSQFQVVVSSMKDLQ